MIALIVILSLHSCRTFDATVGANEKCKVHDERMKVARTWIKYGRRPMEAIIESDSSEYPNPKQYYYGGCRIEKGRAKLYKYYYCSMCNKAAKN